MEKKKNKIVVLIGPGGCGKTSVARALEKTGKFEFAPSTTSRAMREGEKDGYDYFFVTSKKFNTMKEKGEMLEYVLFNGNYYGTNLTKIKNILESKNCVLAIEEHGAKKMKEPFPNETITVFIYVPARELKKRMKDRGDSKTHIKDRLILAKQENASRFKFDYIVENKNGKLDECVKEIIEITKKCK